MEKKFNNENLLEDYILFINKISNIDELHDFISNLSELVYKKYSCITCKTGCYTCCSVTGMPTVYNVEWEKIANYLKKLDNHILEIIKNNNNELLKENKEILLELHNFIHNPSDKNTYENIIKKVNEQLKEKLCPFHIEGKCAIYEVRPSLCRAYGSFLLVSNSEEHYMSCDENKNIFNAFIAEKKIKNISMPYWNRISKKLREIKAKKELKFDFSIIPLWLESELK
ncbi:MAG: YkgJ family cysteine cluster protein [Candidatus Sericytochromatia bacterium]